MTKTIIFLVICLLIAVFLVWYSILKQIHGVYIPQQQSTEYVKPLPRIDMQVPQVDTSTMPGGS